MNTLTYILIFIALLGLSKYLATRSNGSTFNVSGGRVMKVDKIFGYMGVVSIILGAVFPILYYVDVYNRDDRFLVASFLMLALFGLIGLYLLLYHKNTRVKFNETTIKTTNFLGKTKGMNWSEIKTVKFLPALRWLALKDENVTIYVPTTLNGFDQFKNELISKVSDEKYKKVFSKM